MADELRIGCDEPEDGDAVIVSHDPERQAFYVQAPTWDQFQGTVELDKDEARALGEWLLERCNA